MVRPIAFYLPQYYPIPENDDWWGKGFTEWTNVAKAKPLFKGHKQPNLPSELGFYDLRVPEVRERQAELAKEAGIEGFCYWHYWFGTGRRILDRVFNEVVEGGSPDFPFCLAWANQSWSGIWHGEENRILMEQTYGGEDDYTSHFYELLPAFKDKRYIRVNNRILFLVYNPMSLPDPLLFTSLWRELAKKEGLNDFYFIAMDGYTDCRKYGMDGTTFHEPNSHHAIVEKRIDRFLKKNIDPKRVEYSDFVEVTHNKKLASNEFPIVVPNWDNTPRSGKRGLVFKNSTPDLYGKHLLKALSLLKDHNHEQKFVFIKSWNEWAEGNVLEPSVFWGRSYIDKTREIINSEIAP
jgi:lipopolysaccharide biosynthesis protein